jgi:dUTP pyrophosphatase
MMMMRESARRLGEDESHNSKYQLTIVGAAGRIETMTESKALPFKKLDANAVLPERGSVHAAGLDLHSIEPLRLLPKQRVLVRTGLAVAIPEGHYGRIAPRSGLATRMGIDVLAGVIDADYRGEIQCLLYNTSGEAVELRAKTKICQLIIEKIITPTPQWADELPETKRGVGGFGSTG